MKRLRALALVGLVQHAVLATADAAPPHADAARMEQRIHALAEHGANPDGGVSRLAFGEADRAGRRYVEGLLREAGLAVRTDTAGNLIGRREGEAAGLPAIAIGSHIDSVPHGGNYDGDVGVIGAIEVVELLNEGRIRLRHPIEVIVFADEEGGTVGSQAMAGRLRPETLAHMSHSGLVVRDGIRALGGDPERIREAARDPGELAAFLELHIEQGAVLDEADVDIGVVEGIVGIRWWDVTVEGFANHAGTTPMERRQDALIPAAELALAVNRIARTTPGRQVATVGRIRAEPGAPNVIPGRVTMSLEIRDLAAAKIESLFQAIVAESRRIGERHAMPIGFEELDLSLEPAPTDARVRALIARSADELGLSHRPMPSGAGHDAQEMTHVAPTGMIFVPSRGGISHSPKEYTSASDMANGADVLLRTVIAIDRGGLEP